MNKKKLVPKVILVGTPLTFKTKIAFALNDHPRVVGPRKYGCRSPIISGESFEAARYDDLAVFVREQELFNEFVEVSVLPAGSH